MKKQMFLTLILLCAGISLNAMSTDMTEAKPTEEPKVAAMPAPVKEVAPKEEENEVAPTPARDEEEAAPAEDEDFEIDSEEEVAE